MNKKHFLKGLLTVSIAFLVLNSIQSCCNFTCPLKNNKNLISEDVANRNTVEEAGLTLIPPSQVTNKVNVDVRGGIVNRGTETVIYEAALFLDKVSEKQLLSQKRVELDKGEHECLQYNLKTRNLSGKHKIIFTVSKFNEEGKNLDRRVVEKEFNVIPSDVRSTRMIEGAWMGLSHWSEQEGLHWNSDIKKVTPDQWKEMVRSMKKIGMSTIVIQESFRNQYYVGAHSLTPENYEGLAYYPSDLYPGRMNVASKDPIEAILNQADESNMNVFMAVGMFAWFDFTPESLAWHKNVATELWNRYGHHPSFYGFYVSEECAGNLFNGEQTIEGKLTRKKEICDFFREFKKHCNAMAPDKPVMLATNSMDVLDGEDAYPALLQNLDILCPFGFARMPEGDLTGKEVADKLQSLCDDAGSHLWFDLEAFLFNPDMSLYPKPMKEILDDLNLLDNFEKILCYQYPGVFSDPDATFKVGEPSTITLYKDYQKYYNSKK